MYLLSIDINILIYIFFIFINLAISLHKLYYFESYPLGSGDIFTSN